MSDTPRIYIACLAAYNAGTLHGEWIDVSDVDTMSAQIDDMLAKSPEPNVIRQKYICAEKLCQRVFTRQVDSLDFVANAEYGPDCQSCGGDSTPVGKPFPSAEEYAVHDYDNFGSLASGLGEHPNLETLCSVAKAIEEHGEPFIAWAEYHGASHLDYALDTFEERYRGTYKSAADYAEEFTRDCNQIPDFLDFYIDWEKMARDMDMNGDIIAVEESYGTVHIFDGH